MSRLAPEGRASITWVGSGRSGERRGGVRRGSHESKRAEGGNEQGERRASTDLLEEFGDPSLVPLARSLEGATWHPLAVAVRQLAPLDIELHLAPSASASAFTSIASSTSATVVLAARMNARSRRRFCHPRSLLYRCRIAHEIDLLNVASLSEDLIDSTLALAATSLASTSHAALRSPAAGHGASLWHGAHLLLAGPLPLVVAIDPEAVD